VWSLPLDGKLSIVLQDNCIADARNQATEQAEALWEHQSAVQASSNVWKISIKPLKKGSIYKELLHHLSSSSPNLTSANFQRFLDAFWVLTLQREKSKPDNNAK
jgi:hypothetical protein